MAELGLGVHNKDDLGHLVPAVVLLVLKVGAAVIYILYGTCRDSRGGRCVALVVSCKGRVIHVEPTSQEIKVAILSHCPLHLPPLGAYSSARDSFFLSISLHHLCKSPVVPTSTYHRGPYIYSPSAIDTSILNTHPSVWASLPLTSPHSLLSVIVLFIIAPIGAT